MNCDYASELMHLYLYGELAGKSPALGGRLRQLYRACERVAASIPAGPVRGIHRDFYPDQVLVDGGRLWLLDLDLYCAGNPALDAGNFLGHLTEQALRGTGDPDALADREAAFLEEFVADCDGVTHSSVRCHAALTLARQIPRAHCGDVVYEPREEGGSCFLLRLPLQNDPVGADVRTL